MPDKIKNLIDKLIAGSINSEEYKELEQMIHDYPEYQEIVKAHGILDTAEFPANEPDSQAFSQMRQTVIRKIRSKEMNTRTDRFNEMLDRIRSFIMRPEMAVAAITLLLGFFFGRLLPPDTDSLAGGLIKKISFLAEENTQFADTKNAPYQLSNISFKDINGRQVALSFDVNTHLDMVRDKDDPIVREVIAQSLLSPSNPGTELKAISYTENIQDNKIKGALIYSMHNAPLLAVRQNAMANLTKYKNDDDVNSAFMKVLEEEESVKMRLMAMDYFNENKVRTKSLDSLLDNPDIQKSPAVWIKVKKYLQAN